MPKRIDITITGADFAQHVRNHRTRTSPLTIRQRLRLLRRALTP